VGRIADRRLPTAEQATHRPCKPTNRYAHPVDENFLADWLFDEQFDMQATMFKLRGHGPDCPMPSESAGDVVEYNAPVTEIRKKPPRA